MAFVVAELVFTRLLRSGVNRARPFAAAPHSRPALLFCLALRLFCLLVAPLTTSFLWCGCPCSAELVLLYFQGVGEMLLPGEQERV